MTICFATNNLHKIEEVQAALPDWMKLQSLSEIGCTVDLPETQPTLEGNARQKAAYVWEHFGVSCFADDTGLEVAALNGEPGVLSARYAGPQRDSFENMQLLLERLQGQTNRSARFRTVISLVLNGEWHQFEGMVNGRITEQLSGEKGFGYDPVFIPEGHTRTFAQMALEEKNALSHRGRAVAKLVAFLQALNGLR
jgi:XTP/dITP diphosphohydrolase